MKRNALILIFFTLITLKGVSVNHFSYNANFNDKKDHTLLDSILNYGLNFMGTPYHYGSKGPRSFDCSGFTSYIFRHFGYELGRDSRQQAKQSVSIRKYDLQKGDLVFFEGRRQNGVVGHVGIVIEKKENGEFNFIHASTNMGVTVSSSDQAYYSARFLKGGRVVGGENYTPTERDLMSTAVALEELSKTISEDREGTQKLSHEYHTVVKGENLSEIAKKYDVPVSTLKELNHLKSNKIKKGMKLIIKEETLAVTSQHETPTITKPSIASLVQGNLGDTKITHQAPEDAPEKISYSSHKVQKGETLFSIAKENNIPVQRLKELNNLSNDRLSLGQDIILPNTAPSNIIDKKTDTTLASSEQTYKPTKETIKPESIDKYKEKVVYTPALRHKVKKGETISEIADDNNISVKELKKLNKLSSEKIKPGQVLVVKEAKQTVKKIKIDPSEQSDDTNLLAVASKNETATETKVTPQKVTNKSTEEEAKKTTYKVQKGETLYDIARKNNVSVKDIKDMNHLSSDKLKFGQVLTLQKIKEAGSTKTEETTNKQIVEAKNKPIKESPNAIAETRATKHKVLKGETLFDIARDNNMTIEELKELNDISSDNIQPGQTLAVKKGGNTSGANSSKKKEKEKSGITTHVVKNGESLYSIRKKYGCKLDQLKKWNNLSGESLKIGQKLIIYQ